MREREKENEAIKQKHRKEREREEDEIQKLKEAEYEKALNSPAKKIWVPEKYLTEEFLLTEPPKITDY